MATAGEESEQAWSSFFEEMMNRGMRQPLMVSSDVHKGPIKAITRAFPKARRQLCLAHKMRNLINKVPLNVQKEIKAHAHDVYYACDRESAEVPGAKFIERYADIYPEMVRIFQADPDIYLIRLDFPIGHRRIIRTTNLIERSFAEEKHRSKIIPRHQNEKGAIKLVFGVLIRASYNWRRININELDLAILRKIRKTIVADLENEEKISYEWAA